MPPIVETKLVNPNTSIEIITDITEVDNKSDLKYVKDNTTSKELEKDSYEHKESSSTQTSSCSSLLHKRKTHCYYAGGGFYKPTITYSGSLLSRHPKRNMSSTTQKILSAKFLRVKQLQSEMAELQKRISELQEENRTLRNIQKRQDVTLKKYESQESYLPQLIKSHEEEIRVLTLKYKKLRSSYNELESRHNKQCTELMNMKDRHKHLLQISQDKHLLQREQLTKQMEEMKITINDLKNKIKFQSRKLDLETKNFKYQVASEMNKNKVLQEQLKQYQEQVHKLQFTLKEKERYMANCKINQHIVNKMNQLKLKVSSNKTKTFSRLCTDSEKENRKYDYTFNPGKDASTGTASTTKEATAENSFNDFDLDSDSKTDFTRTSTGGAFEEKSNYSSEINFNTSKTYSPEYDEKPHIRKTESPPLSSYFEIKGSNMPKNEVNETTEKSKSSDKSAVTGETSLSGTPQTPVLNPPSEVKTGSYFPDLHRHGNEKLKNNPDQLDTGSEKSDDYKFVDETVSWLEFHEKTKGGGEIGNAATVVALGKIGNSTSPPRLGGKSNSTQKGEDSLPYDKKSALLSALREIDLETQISTTFDLDGNTFTEQKSVSITKCDKSNKPLKTRV